MRWVAIVPLVSGLLALVYMTVLVTRSIERQRRPKSSVWALEDPGQETAGELALDSSALWGELDFFKSLYLVLRGDLGEYRQLTAEEVSNIIARLERVERSSRQSEEDLKYHRVQLEEINARGWPLRVVPERDETLDDSEAPEDPEERAIS